ncbi:MAG: family 43 glycosylhydrolase [Firmicutes bacterium]|nr:family 43 glycosylhydrolase [Bacillota bacterium]
MLMRFKNRKKAVLFRLFIVIAVIGLVTAANASNPLITSIYTADADCLVANNAFYVYCGRDEAAAGQQAFVMDEWHILKSTDMQNWTDLGVKLSLSNFSWANANAWAGSVCYKNGKYWWYVPVNDRATNAMAIGVASSTSPEGPFTDALGRALITNQTPNCNIFNIDPGVFVDDDGQAYLYWGGYWAVRAVKLNDDMISFSGTPVQPSGIPTSGTTRYWEAPTLRKYNGLYYFSYAANQNPATIEYCTATNPMGPWTYRGRILDTTTPTGTNHHSYNQTPFGGRYFCVYHTSPAGDDYHRRVNCDEMYYNADGTIRKVVQTSAGPSPVTGNPTPTPTRRGATPTPTRVATPTPTRRVANTPTPTQRPTGGYAVAYVIQSDWGAGATISVTITNNSTAAVNGWTLAFTFPGNQVITNLWNGTYTQSGASVSVKDAGYNANIPANGGSTNFGFNLNYSGANAKPTAFTLNGTACTLL